MWSHSRYLEEVKEPPKGQLRRRGQIFGAFFRRLVQVLTTPRRSKEYADKFRFLWGICPGKDRPMLAPRLALLCKGTAWSQVKNLDSAKLTDGKTGYKTLLLALPTWEESAELQIYNHFGRAFYKTVQKPDETAMSYVNRINVAFQEVGMETTVKAVKAFVILRQSGLSVEDKKRVMCMTRTKSRERCEASRPRSWDKMDKEMQPEKGSDIP